MSIFNRHCVALQILIIVFALLSSGCAPIPRPTGAESAVRPFTIGAIPDQDPEKLQRLYGKLADYLSAELGVPVVYKPVTDYTASVTAFSIGDLDMVWFGGLTGVQAFVAMTARATMPEAQIPITEAAIYVATAPKSNGVYVAYKAAMRAAKENGSLLPPRHILNAPTKLMKSEGYGTGYAYDHDAEEAFSGQDYFPEALGRQTFYAPPERGFEREIRKRLEYWAKLRKERGS